MEQIAPESKEFLVSLFTDLREDLAKQTGAGGPGHPSAETIACKGATYDALLNGLADDGDLSGDETLLEYVVGLARATDEANQYEQAVLEHRAFAELVWALGGDSSIRSKTAGVDWDGLLARLLHQTQFQIIEAMSWVGRPVSASQLAQVLDRDLRELSAVSYHLRRLRQLRIVRPSGVTSVRGAKERFYRLVAAVGKP